eukprot:TRINITY_DN3100_c0_g1_i1.p1 TRINITY_DN3100_c0_g1~~TRINITY_DN3100_c0_g1_i1.p1  ORF type:complete len:524 (-),score=99.67 TRINITY_DN3100_c0_g1_i1:22-1521(-)
MQPTLVRAPWTKHDGFVNSLSGLHRELIQFVEWVAPRPEEVEVVSSIVKRIRVAVKSRWPSASIKLIGSRKTGLAVPSSDIDLVMLNPELSPEKNLAAMFQLANILVEQGLVDQPPRVLSATKVPILKFVEKESKLAVDIAVGITAGVANTEIVKDLLCTHSDLRSLVLVIKFLLKQRGLNDTFLGGIGSYTLVIMVAAYLQMRQKTGAPPPLENERLAVLVLGFLEFFAYHFDYAHCSLSVRNGGSVILKQARNWFQQSKPFLLSVEDPNIPSIDIGAAAYRIDMCVATFHQIYGKLVAAVYSPPKRSMASIFMNVAPVTVAEYTSRKAVLALGRASRHSASSRSRERHAKKHPRSSTRGKKKTPLNYENSSPRTQSPTPKAALSPKRPLSPHTLSRVTQQVAQPSPLHAPPPIPATFSSQTNHPRPPQLSTPAVPMPTRQRKRKTNTMPTHSKPLPRSPVCSSERERERLVDSPASLGFSPNPRLLDRHTSHVVSQT